MNSRTEGLMYPSVKFLRASSNLQSFTPVRKSDICQNNQNGNFSGAEAREFYEGLLQENNETYSDRSPRHSKRRKKSETTAKYLSKRKQINKNVNRESDIDFKNKALSKRQENLFLKMAQDGDTDGLQGFIRDNKVNINATDSFGWTALMCAAKSGHKACIRLLLNQGADETLQNNLGHTAMDIAKQSGHQDVFDRREKTRRRCESLDSSVEQTCNICKTNFFGPKVEHDTSTAHLFNCQYKSEKTFYHIPEDNIGFRLMQQKGWDKEKGEKLFELQKVTKFAA